MDPTRPADRSTSPTDGSRGAEEAGRPAAAKGRPGPVRLALYAVGVVAGGVAVVEVVPRVAGTPWRSVGHVLLALPAWALPALVVLWLAGLLANTVTLAAALPGLTHRRALVLSLTGSAVANVLPLGGAAGVALNYEMTRRWGFSGTGFASYTMVTNLVDVLAKLALPALVLPLLAWGVPMPSGLSRAIVAAAGALPVLAALTALALLVPRAAARLGARVERIRASVAGILVAAWGRLGSGVLVYTGLLFALLVACLGLTGAGVALPMVLVAFCAERLATLVNLTPGGLGVVEVGLVGALMLAPGASAAGVAAGVLLYRALTFGLEIPVGGLLLAAWTWAGARTGRGAVTA